AGVNQVVIALTSFFVLYSLTSWLAMLAAVPILPLEGPDGLHRPSLLLLLQFPSTIHEGGTCPYAT
ncbi:MAG: hypothetical protein ACREUF_13990, partial [Solimonas sp.]